MPTEIITNIIIILVAFALFLTLKLPRTPKHIFYGLILLGVGGIKLFNYYNFVAFDIPNIPLITYALNIAVMVSGGSLIFDGFKEGAIIGGSSFILGVVIILLSLIPTLYNLNAITFVLPLYPEFINYYLHIASGIFLFIATFAVPR